MLRDRIGLGLGLLVFLLPGCGGNEGDATTPGLPPSTPTAVTPASGESETTTLSGLTPSERAEYYHLAEGSELYPLAWIRALENSATGKPFLEDTARFGLIADEKTEQSDGGVLPIGMTANVSRGLPFVGKMIGVNCAACHVGQVEYKGKAVRLDGGPNLFDLNRFYQELFESAKDTVDDPARLSAFMDRLSQAQGEDRAVASRTARLLRVYTAIKAAQPETLVEDEKEIAAHIKTLIDDAKSRVGTDLEAIGLGRATRAKLREAIAEQHEKDVDELVRLIQRTPAKGLLSALAPLKERADAVRESVEDLVVDLKLLLGRFAFLKRLKELHEIDTTVVPGPGRIDAFVNVRDLVYPSADKIPPTSPVSFPYIWNLNQFVWLHWDGNTTSVLERNVGQSMGLGAVVLIPGHPGEDDDGSAYASTVLPQNLYRLETLTRKLKTPRWPADVLGPVDEQKAARGEKLYDKACVSCHMKPADALALQAEMKAKGEFTYDPPWEKLYPVDEIGTDPARARNFAIKLGRGTPDERDFAADLQKVSTAVRDRAYKDNNIAADEQAEMDLPDYKEGESKGPALRWRTTGKYIARPLFGVWGTAPYLHNASVPTLDDLLKPAADRPAEFVVGYREFDPAAVGYVHKPADIPAELKDEHGEYRAPLMLFRTRDADGKAAVGDSNAGHEYGTEFGEAERADLIEYLKTL